MSAPTPRPGTGRQLLALVVVFVVGLALGITCRDLVLTVLGSLVSAWAVLGERR